MVYSLTIILGVLGNVGIGVAFTTDKAISVYHLERWKGIMQKEKNRVWEAKEGGGKRTDEG